MRALRVVGVLAFVSLALSVLTGTHYYLALRLVLEPAWPAALQSGLLAALVLLGASLVIVPIAERLAPLPLVRVLAWPSSVWMGLMFLLFVGLAGSDLLLWLAAGPAQAAVAGAELPGDPSRIRALLVGALALGAGGVGVANALRGPQSRRVEITLARWPRALDGFRIVQISDIHIGPILGRRFARDLVRRCNALEPDLLAVTGDLVDGGVRQLASEVEPFAELRAAHGVYFVTGNHDHYSGARDWVDIISGLGLRVLRNEHVTLEVNGVAFDLAGVDDHQGSFEEGWREDLPRALEGRDPARACVLLAHDPRTFKRARRMGVDLQLSGHTHGGQIWPFRYLVRIATRWVDGLHRDGDASIYVSRGTGFWGPPMRLGAPAEITELVLRAG
jgi:predicted MPP superfamily phosphohydrolase